MNSTKLKKEIRKCASSFARRHNFTVDDSHASALIFCNLDDCFHPDSLRAIHEAPDWNARTLKKHQNVKGVLEMQSSNSSDALLMNIFCHPLIGKWAGVRKILRADVKSISFGVPGAVHINKGQSDRTEIDMTLPSAFCEAKLIEDDFKHKRKEIVESYDGLYKAFHVESLPRVGTDYDNYQIIRNLLAAKQHNRDHILFCDERRTDLVRRYMTTVSCLQDSKDRLRCRVICWQEIAAVCGKLLREWIEEKYGIC